jgi:hypothetical protein
VLAQAKKYVKMNLRLGMEEEFKKKYPAEMFE